MEASFYLTRPLFQCSCQKNRLCLKCPCFRTKRPRMNLIYSKKQSYGVVTQACCFHVMAQFNIVNINWEMLYCDVLMICIHLLLLKFLKCFVVNRSCVGVDVDFIVSEEWNSTCLLGSDARHTSLQIYSYSEEGNTSRKWDILMCWWISCMNLLLTQSTTFKS